MLVMLCSTAGFGCSHYGGHIALTGLAGLEAAPAASFPLPGENIYSALVLRLLLP